MCSTLALLLLLAVSVSVSGALSILYTHHVCSSHIFHGTEAQMNMHVAAAIPLAVQQRVFDVDSTSTVFGIQVNGFS